MTLVQTSIWTYGGQCYTARRTDVDALERANGHLTCPNCERRVIRLSKRPKISTTTAAVLTPHSDEGAVDRWTGYCPCGAPCLTVFND